MTAPAPPVEWPAGHRAAAAFTFDVDAESAVLSADPASGQRPSLLSQQSYGPLVGVPRLLRILDRQGVRATFFVPGHTAHRYPDVVRSIAAAGHELAHHGYLHESLVGADESTERGYLERGIEALVDVAGERPVGYRAPMWELTPNSVRLLAEYGFDYDSSLMDADWPYQLAATAERTLVEIPVQWALDDWERYCFLPGISEHAIQSPDSVVRSWCLEFDAMSAEGGCFVLTNHPFLSGRPGRAAALEELIAHVRAHPDVWVAPLAEIARHVRRLGPPVGGPRVPPASP